MDFEDARHRGSDLREPMFGCTTADETARIVVDSFAAIDMALGPIVGGRGVVALFNRSVHLASVRCAWLRGDVEPSRVALELVALGEALMRQDPEEAANGGSDLLHTFRTLLSTLIGESLTAKLLDPVWSRFPIDGSRKASP